MKNNLIIFAYLTIWIGILIYVGEVSFPEMFGETVIPTTKKFWIDIYAYFSAGGTIAWPLVFSLFFWVILGSFGSLILMMTGPSIVPAFRKYIKSTKKSMPKKRKVKYPSC